jgi:hypothetical protein
LIYLFIYGKNSALNGEEEEQDSFSDCHGHFFCIVDSTCGILAVMEVKKTLIRAQIQYRTKLEHMRPTRFRRAAEYLNVF